MGDEGGPGQCRLLAGPAALTAQLLLAVLALASLAYKRWVPGCGHLPIPLLHMNMKRLKCHMHPRTHWNRLFQSQTC